MSEVIKNLVALEDDARAYGFVYPTVEDVIGQIRDECQEVLDAIDNHESEARRQEEIGDLIHATMALCYQQGFDVEQTLGLSVEKFDKRMQNLKLVVAEEGLENLQGQSLSYMLSLWKKAKIANLE